MMGTELLGLLADIAAELEMFGCSCVFRAEDLAWMPRGWERASA